MKTDIKKHENGGAKSWIKTHLSDIIPVLGLILVLVFFNAVSGGKVFTKTNFNTLFNEAFSLLIVTYALIFVMAQGKNDMSLGGVVALAAALAAHASSISGNLVLPVALLVGLLCGLLNGLIVTEFRIDSFIATIAMSFILKGFVELLLQSGVRSIPIKMMMLDSQQLKITVALVFGIISFILFKFTMFGKHCRAIGSRMEVCRQSGVRVKLVQYGSYVFTGLASGLVAFFFLIRSGAANIGTASNLEFNALQALMLGGVLITGGSSVKFRSAVIGSITMAALANGMTLWGVETLTQQLIKGFIFLIVIALTFERKSVEVIK